MTGGLYLWKDGRDIPDPPPSLSMLLTRGQAGSTNLVNTRGAKVAEIMGRVRKRQSEVGYEGDYRGWIKKVTPADLQ